MKKALMTLALAAFAFAANAQFVIGGNIDFDHKGNTAGDLHQNATTDFSIMPKFGYWLNDKMQVGIQFGMGYHYERDYYPVDKDSKPSDEFYKSQTSTNWNIAPYFRYNVATWRNFSVFCEAQLALGISPKGSYKDNNPYTGKETSGDLDTRAFNLNLNVVPGLNYALNENFSLDLYINLLGLYYDYQTTTTTTIDPLTNKSEDNTTYDHNWGLKANMNGQSLYSHLSNFTIGFNYSF